MKLAKLVLLGAAYFLTACHKVNDSAPQQLSQQLKSVETPVISEMPTAEAPPSLASIRFAKVITFEREADAQVDELKITPLSLKKTLPVRAEVLLIPLTDGLAALRTQVVKVTSVENPCSSSLPRLFEIKLSSIKDKSWLSAAASFEACVIYPAIASARALKPGELQDTQLPKKITPANIVVALDTNNDQQPELLLVEYCCEKPEQDRKTCDLTCSAVYIREANGQWRLAETQTPC